jgi:hypothetical protein
VFQEGVTPKYQIYRGTDLAGPVYRVTMTCPPTEDDFKSYWAAGKGFPPKLYFRALAVSMWRTEKEARKLARNGKFGTCVATVELNDDRVSLALTDEYTGHLSVWGYSRFLIKCVVDCVDTGKAEN